MVGRTVSHYRVLKLLGSGGMGTAYQAEETRLGRQAALKFLPAELPHDRHALDRFQREARAASALHHPHICTIHDIHEAEGERSIARKPRPANVMLTKTGAKLLDFGLAKLAGHGDQPAAAQVASMPTRSAPLTAEGTIVGTLQYMAPEHVEGKPADARTDLWALGAILYEMLTGKRAFEGTSAASLIGNIMNAEPAALTTLQPLTPLGVDRLVKRCLAKSPEDRPDTAHDVADELR
jgi:serine/threonine protein kinase